MSLVKKTTVGIIWHFFEMMSKRGLNAVITILLALFLTPDDYGLVAMMAVFTAVANELMESGFRQAVIRQKDATQEYYNTAFFANILMGFFAYMVLFVSAPLISDFYDETRLTLLIRVVGIAIIINSLGVVQSAILNRELRFKSQLGVSVPATAISGTIAIIMAYLGFGVWSLIAQTILFSIFTTIFLWSLKLWRPSKKASYSSFKEMFGFGSNIFVTNFLEILFQNIYIIVIAKFFAVTIAGYYFFAQKIRDVTMTQFVKTIQVVTFPALATMQQNDRALKSGYRKVIKVSTFMLFPVMLFLAVLAEPFFITLQLGDKWLPAVPYLQLMCIAGLMYPLHQINMNILQIKGRTDILLYTETLKKLFTALILALTIKYGVMGILIGQIIATVFSYIPNTYYSKKLIDYSASEQISDLLPSLLVSGLVSIIIYYFLPLVALPAFAKLLLFGLWGGIMYIGISHIIKNEALFMLKANLESIFRREKDI